jgi:two-component system response regulator HydG
MYFRSLKSKLVLIVSTLVIVSGILISLLVNQRYSAGLLENMIAQAENLAHAIALEAAEEILINDLVSLQKMLDHQIRSHENISYIFILRDGVVIGHTFPKGVPSGLVSANALSTANQFHVQEIESTKGEKYLDMAWAVFDGKAGVLRIGFSERPYYKKIERLWLQMCGITLSILLVAIAITLYFMSRITRPLGELTLATRRIDQGELGVRVKEEGHDEVGKLATSFNAMVTRMEDYTGRLKEQTMELERAHNQTRTFCSIVREIGGLRELKDIGVHLIGRFTQILKCKQMVLFIFNEYRNRLYAMTAERLNLYEEPEIIQGTRSALEETRKTRFIREMPFRDLIVPDAFQGAARHAIIPVFYEEQAFGALVTACPENCTCNKEEVESAGLILNQTSGLLKRALSQQEEIRKLQNRLDTKAEFSGLVGKDPKMQTIYKLIEDIAPTDATVLIQGESGTGKELVANAVHQKSPRKGKPLIVINCSAYPETLLESELFGHEKGAFTGASRQKAGRFEQAEGGTIFLDEIGEISPSAQIKLLRILQTRKFERLGGEETLSVDVRILAATNKDLLLEVKKGQFREDLYYRLHVIPIQIPPLRDRRNDIPLLARHFVQRFAREQGKDIEEISSDAMRLLLDYFWPGNVRELENSIEHATVLAKGKKIEAFDLPTTLAHTAAHEGQHVQQTTMAENEKTLLTNILEECGWNKKATAARLGISRNTLYAKIKKYQINRPTRH